MSKKWTNKQTNKQTDDKKKKKQKLNKYKITQRLQTLTHIKS